MKHVKRDFMHVAMCAPMIVLAIVLLAAGRATAAMTADPS